MWTLALSFLIILAAIAAYGGLHSWLASLQAKALARRSLGQTADRVYRLAYNIVAVISLLPVLALPAILPDHRLYTIPLPWTLFTLAIQGLAALVLLVGVLQTGLWSFLGLEQLLAPPDRQPPELVLGGLYRWVRHPLYTAGLVFIWLTPVMTWNVLALNLGLSAYLFIGALFEERKLTREFGLAYRSYQQRTPMFFPSLTRKREEDFKV
jgi:protein-S-isoprenylcysteine O-methyltransferase Ste14